MNNQGWIKLHRKIVDNKIWANSDGLKVWLWCLLKASHNKVTILVGRQNVNLDDGEFIFGRLSASEELCMSPSTVRNWITFLKQDSYLDIKSNNKYSIITIKNWNDYQSLDSKVDNKIKTNEKQIDTNNNDKNDKNNKDIDVLLSMFNKNFKRKFTFTKTRSEKLKQRLKTFTMEQIMESLNNLSASKFAQGDNDRGWTADPDYFLRSDEIVDRWLNSTIKKDNIISLN